MVLFRLSWLINGLGRGGGTGRAALEPSEWPLNSVNDGRLEDERLLCLTEGGGVTDL